jgi:hypothetical protein
MSEDNRTPEEKAANPMRPLFNGPVPELPANVAQSGPATRRAMEIGAMFADKIWDEQLRFKTTDFAVGFLMRIFSFIAAVIGADNTIKIFEQVQIGLMSLDIMQKRQDGTPPPQAVQSSWKDKPDCEGWYWRKEEDGRAYVVNVRKRPGHEYLCIELDPYGQGRRDFVAVAKIRGSWAGPIVPPKE